MIVNKKIMEADEIRAELARRKLSKRKLSEATGINYHYLIEILNGYYPATKRREQITTFLQQEVL